jgi:hypothetical protein
VAVARLLSLMPERQGGETTMPGPIIDVAVRGRCGGWSNAAEGRGPPSGSALVLVDDAAEDIAAADGAGMSRT